MISKEIKIELPENMSERIDRYVSRIGLLTRGQIKARNLVVYDKEGGREIKLASKVKEGDSFYLEWDEEADHDLVAEKLDLDILYEDDHVVVLNKAPGMVVHPAMGNWTGTVVNGLLHHNREMADKFSSDEGRPGIVHRLDKDTSGVLITAKDTKSLEILSTQFRERETEKVYLALVKGVPPHSTGTIEGFMIRDKRDRKKFALTQDDERGKWSQSDYRVKERFEHYTLLEVSIHTGRTHQIRVHLRSLNKPILGDTMYGRKDNNFPDAPLMLHSWKLGITLPGEEEQRVFEAPVSEQFEAVLERLRVEQKL